MLTAEAQSLAVFVTNEFLMWYDSRPVQRWGKDCIISSLWLHTESFLCDWTKSFNYLDIVSGHW